MNHFVLFVYGLVGLLLPSTRFFGLKRLLLRLAGAQVGSGVRCASSARFALGGALVIGEDTWLGHDVLVVGGDSPIRIGARCDIAPRVTIVSGSHEIDSSGPRVAGAGFSSPITIGDGCWLCTGATILGGTELGSHCVVAAGAVVSGSFPAHSLIGGVPARIIKQLADDGHQPISRVDSD